ncbi:MAG: DUF1073 domain-containing protein [Gemmatimonadota bacterium]|nr:MAG: DUF1073 domain-containing protein [Gemmatimonadota bacterium]
MDSLLNTATGMGVAAQDKGASTSVDVARTALTNRQLTTLLTFNGYVVDYFDKLEDVATGFGWSLQVDKQKSDALHEDEERLDVYSRVGEAFRSGQEYGGCLLLPVIDDDATTPEDLLRPLNPESVTRVHALHVFHWDEFIPVDYETSMLDNGFREPKTWRITPKNAGWIPPADESGFGPWETTSRGFTIHHSRVLYFRGMRSKPYERAANGGRDRSVVQHLWDALVGIGGVDAGAATMAQEMNYTTIKVAGLGRMEASSAWSTILTRFKIMDLGRSLYNALLIGEDDAHERHTANASGYRELKDGAKSTWASHTGMPETLAFGDTPSGLNTDGEASRRNWDRKGVVLQRKVVGPPLKRLYFDFLIPAHGGGETEALRDARLVFEPIGTLTRKQRSDMDRHDAETATMLVERGVLYPDEIREAYYGKDGKRPIGPVEPLRGGVTGGLSPTTLKWLDKVAASGSDGAIKSAEIALAMLKSGEATDIPTEIEPPEVPPALAGAAGIPGEDEDMTEDGREGASPERRAERNPVGVQNGGESE